MGVVALYNMVGLVLACSVLQHTTTTVNAMGATAERHAAAKASRSPLLPLTVKGNQIGTIDPNGTFSPKQLRGVSGTGGDFACVQGYNIFDGDTSVDPYMTGMKSWAIDVVRVPVNEDCLLGINGVKPQYGGPVYQDAMFHYIESLLGNGFYVILTLHWSAPGTVVATGQQPMPDKDHSIDFWKVFAARFGNDTRVIFDLFNEPYPGHNTVDSTEAWECWKYGSVGQNCSDINFKAVGFDELVATLRSKEVNATNIFMLGGINYANSLTRWLSYVPKDPLQRLAASWHSYATNYCNNEICWDLFIAPIAAKYPLVTGELGESDCKGKYILPLMKWLDALHNGGRGTSYLAWVWEPWPCDAGPSLISNYTNGVCTDSYGCDYKQHLLKRNHSA